MKLKTARITWVEIPTFRSYFCRIFCIFNLIDSSRAVRDLMICNSVLQDYPAGHSAPLPRKKGRACILCPAILHQQEILVATFKSARSNDHVATLVARLLIGFRTLLLYDVFPFLKSLVDYCFWKEANGINRQDNVNNCDASNVPLLKRRLFRLR